MEIGDIWRQAARCWSPTRCRLSKLKPDLSLFITVIVFTSLSFFIFGATCLFSARMRVEFDRYGLSRFRALTGVLEIAGALGLLVGMAYPAVGVLAACGLALLMSMGVAARVRIRDTIPQLLPATFYCALSVYLIFGY